MSSTKKVPALVLNLGHAPNTWHMVTGFPGYYHPSKPVPATGGVWEVDKERAEQAHKDDGCPLGLVEVTEKEADAVRQELRELVAHQARLLRNLKQSAEGAEVTQIHDETAAIGGKE